MTHTRLMAAVAMLAAVSCRDNVTAPIVENGLRLSASVVVDSSGVRTLVATLTLTNPASVDHPILWGEDCAGNGPLDVRAFRGTTLVWESARVASLAGCPVAAIQSSIAANGSGAFQFRLPLEEILGDSLPVGDYTFTVQPTLASPTFVSQVDAGSLKLADPIVVPLGTNLDGTWKGTAGPLSVTLSLTWSADTVRGSGTYTMASTTSSNCLSADGTGGTVTFAASRTNDFVSGVLWFSNTWTPAYSGHLRSADLFDGAVHTVDTGSCSLSLTRGP